MVSIANSEEWSRTIGNEARDWWRKNWVPVLVAFVVQLVLYSSLATQFIFTNHTFPHISVDSYPSFRTYVEGRWFSDILIRLTGGGGTASFQSIIAFALQALNGVLFAGLLNVRGNLNRTLVSLIIALHPALLDYYAFSAYAISFTFGDTLAILSLVLLDRKGAVWWTWPVAGLGFMLTLATYQPKLAVFAVVALGWLTAKAASPETDVKTLPRMVAAAAAASVLGLIFYLLSLHFTLSTDVSLRGVGNNNMNTTAEAAQQFIASYAYVAKSFNLQLQTMPYQTGSFVWILLLFGALTLAIRCFRRGAVSFAIFLLGAILILPAINLSSIANKNTWTDTGRLSVGYAYCVGLLAAAPMFGKWQQLAARIISCLSLYGFFVISTQENQYISTKAVFEISLMNRIVARIESILPNDQMRALVVVGDALFQYGSALQAAPDRALLPLFHEPTYIFYRQPQLTNFFMGREVIRSPTDEERAAATLGAAGRPEWPSPGSVYLDSDTVVVVLNRPPGP